MLVVETGQHHHGNPRVLSADPGQSVDPVGVVQMQVQQDAVGSGGRDLTLGVGHGRRPGHVHVDAGIGDQLLDDDRVSAVVFDQQQRQRVAAVRDAAGSRRFGGSTHVTDRCAIGNSPRIPGRRGRRDGVSATALRTVRAVLPLVICERSPV